MQDDVLFTLKKGVKKLYIRLLFSFMETSFTPGLLIQKIFLHFPKILMPASLK